MRTILFFSILMLSLSSNSQTVTFVWAKQMGNLAAMTYYDVGRSIAIDDSGHIYTTGSFGSVVDFDPGPGIQNLTSNGFEDVFIQKLDADGNFLWAKQMGGTDYDLGTSIAIDASGNVYTTGYFGGTVDFDPGVGINNLTSNGDPDIFIQKLDAQGNFLWAKQIGGLYWDYGTSIAIDASGHVYTTGFFSDMVDFDPGAGVSNLASKGSRDIFIQKLDLNGNFIWVKQMGGTGYDGGRSITVDASGQIYTTGSFETTVDFDPGVGINNLTSNGGADVFIQKLDGNGDFLWAKKMGGGAADDGGNSITLDASGNVYTTGYFWDTVDFDPGADVNYLSSNGDADIFIQKLDANGNFLWAKHMGGSGYYDEGTSIATDASGNVYTTGYFWYTVDFDPGVGVNNLTSNGGGDIFIQKLDANGNFIWVKHMGGISLNYLDVGYSITVDAFGNVYSTGAFSGTVDFDPGVGVNNLTSHGVKDIFIQKLKAEGVGIIEDKFGVKFHVYPNPTTGNFSIDLGEQYNDVSIAISDLTGKIIQSMSYTNSQVLEVNLEESAGIYLLIVESADKKAVIKLVKE